MFDLLQYCVKEGEKCGAQFVEARAEEVSQLVMVRENDQIKETNVVRRKGIGITSHYKGVTGYSHTAKLDRDSLKECAARSFGIAKASEKIALLRLEFPPAPKKSDSLSAALKKHPRTVEIAAKKAMLDEATKAAKEHGESVSSIIGMYGELYGERSFSNSEGTEIKWEPCVVDLRVSVASKDPSGGLADAGDGMGGTIGLERYELPGKTPRDFGINAAKWAKEKMGAKKAPAGEFRAMCCNLLTGVLAHESLGHLSEADFVLSGNSPLSGKMGSQIGSKHATIYDEGAPDPALCGFQLPYDDEGTRTTKTVIIEGGVLKSYLHSRATAQKLGGQPTGNARALNFTYMPIPRMKNTYFHPGDMTEDEAVSELKNGVYAIRTSGGQVNMDGSFIFKAVRGYWVEGGEKKYPLKDVTLAGNILSLLHNIEGATKDLEIISGYFGGCGKGGQFPLPVGMGGPKLLISKVRFGGEQ